MKMIVLLVSLCLGLYVTTQSAEPTIPVPPQEKEILGTWIGFDAEAVVFYRLVIKEKAGLFAYSIPGYPVRAYEVVSWSLKQSQIYLDMVGSTNTTERIHSGGPATSYRLDLTIEAADGTGGGWTRKITFFEKRKSRRE